ALGVPIALVVRPDSGHPLVVRLADEVDGDSAVGALENRAFIAEMHLAGLSAVVQPWCDLDRERHLAPDTPDHTHQTMPGRRNRAPDDRHEVDDLTYAGL